MIFLVDLLLMLIDLTCSIVNAVVQTFLRPRLKCVDGELCLITGAGGALGRLFALEFAKEGARLVLWDCDEAANELTASLARELGAQVHAYTVDLSKRQGIYEAAERVRAEVGDVSMLVNNAGVVAGRRLLDCPDELLERTLLVNCHALFWVSTLAHGARVLRTTGWLILPLAVVSKGGGTATNKIVNCAAARP